MSYIGSVQDWKDEMSCSYGEMHKDVYGSRYNPDFSQYTMEDVLSTLNGMHLMLLEAIMEDEKRECRWEARKMFNRLMVAEAAVTLGGAVFENPDWDEQCDRDPMYAEWAKVHKFCYFMPEKPFTNDQLKSMGAI